MVDAVLACAGSAAFKGGELQRQAIMVEKINGTAVNER
jgi:hypothetical protein